MEKVYKYKTEQDEFIGENIIAKDVGAEYKYIHSNPIWNICEFILYRIIMTPIAFLYSKIKFRMKIIGREKLKEVKEGYFVYANHTQPILDTFAPTIASFNSKVYIICNRDNISIPFMGRLNKMLGAIPIPNRIEAMRNFIDCVNKRAEKNVVVIYPEAHVWPYYTKIRNFEDTSFKYPVKLNKPIFTYTTVYKERRNKNPKIEIYIDGPFYKDENLSVKEAQKELRNKAYFTMMERSKLSNTEYVKYEKIKEN